MTQFRQMLKECEEEFNMSSNEHTQKTRSLLSAWFNSFFASIYIVENREDDILHMVWPPRTPEQSAKGFPNSYIDGWVMVMYNYHLILFRRDTTSTEELSLDRLGLAEFLTCVKILILCAFTSCLSCTINYSTSYTSCLHKSEQSKYCKKFPAYRQHY